MPANDLTWDDVAIHLEAIAPGNAYGPETRFDALPTFHRLATLRWFADALDQPTDLEVLRQYDTLGRAFAWLRDALRSGCRLASHVGAPAPRSPPHAASTSRVHLRPLRDEDLGPLYDAAFDPWLGSAWRYRGRTMPPDDFLATLHDGVRAQYVVTIAPTGIPVGLVTAYDHNQAGMHCKVAFLRFGARVPGDSGAVLEGMIAFLGHLFSTYPYRKVFAEVPSYNMALFSPEFATDEATLRDYLFHDGKFVDLHIVSIERTRWEALAEATGW